MVQDMDNWCKRKKHFLYQIYVHMEPKSDLTNIYTHTLMQTSEDKPSRFPLHLSIDSRYINWLDGKW